MECRECHHANPVGSRFCNKCGCKVSGESFASMTINQIDGERKHVTIMFSDLSGYTSMNERLDPEEVKEIMSLIFNKVTEIVHGYEGFIEKFIGDAVMAVFGIPEAHEDDPVRAIKAAKDMHAAIESISPQFEEKIGYPLALHTGINTGLVITDKINVEKGTHGLIGDTINLASRLGSLAKAGETVVGPDTYKQALNFFEFENLEPTVVKGKQKPVNIYKVKSARQQPSKMHRIQGLRAGLIGRNQEMDILAEATDRLKRGQGNVVAISGNAGTGKSRLIHEFKTKIKANQFQWNEGHSYGYKQNTPYFPFVNMLAHAFKVEEGDSPDRIRNKIESSLNSILGDNNTAKPYIGGLFSLPYSEVEGVSPEFWKASLYDAINDILKALVQRGPCIFFIEDLHWADPSSVELLHRLIENFSVSILFLCTYRPPFDLLKNFKLKNKNIGNYITIKLKELNASQSHQMLSSLLKTQAIPSELFEFSQIMTEGNPFYLEEVVNSLIESEVIVRENGLWSFTKKLTGADIPTSIQGVLTARIDRLDKGIKRIVQEASVIGRSFFYEILKRISQVDASVDQCLDSLKELDLIRIRSLEPELEYIFKHALTQEVVYNGLLKKERQKIHERIGNVIESLFDSRISEFYETLAYHFVQSGTVLKAVDYLVKSGLKNLQRYSLDESHEYFKQAFDLIILSKDDQNKNEVMIDILNKWSFVFYYRGEFKEHQQLLLSQETIAENINDKEILGMFYAWMGLNLWTRNNYNDSYKYLQKAIIQGDAIGSKKVTGYACAWLSWICAELGLFDEGVDYGIKANDIAKSIKSDHYLYFKSLAGVGYNNFFLGDVKKCLEIGKTLVEYGTRHSQGRCLVLGYNIEGLGYFSAGDMDLAITACKKALEISVDPFYSKMPKICLATLYLKIDKIEEAEKLFDDVINYCSIYGCDNMHSFAKFGYGIISLSNGKMSKGIQIVKESLKDFNDQKRKGSVSMYEYGYAGIYLEIVKGNKKVSLMNIFKNMGFILSNMFSAGKKAETNLNRVVKLSEEVGTKGIAGQAHYDLGTLHRLKKRKDKARMHFEKAIRIFEETGAYMFLKQAEEALKSMG